MLDRKEMKNSIIIPLTSALETNRDGEQFYATL
jgi:hypothetical protein